MLKEYFPRAKLHSRRLQEFTGVLATLYKQAQNNTLIVRKSVLDHKTCTLGY